MRALAGVTEKIGFVVSLVFKVQSNRFLLHNVLDLSMCVLKRQEEKMMCSRFQILLSFSCSVVSDSSLPHGL